MSPALRWILWALLAAESGGAAGNARGDEALSPRAAMRAAAEELAEVVPGPHPRADAASTQKVRTPPSDRKDQNDLKDSQDALQAAMQNAARAEVERELAASGRQGLGRGAGGGKAAGAANNGKDARDEVHGAAVQAQAAKVVGVQYSRGLAKGHDKAPGRDGPGNGNGNGRSFGAGGAPRPK